MNVFFLTVAMMTVMIVSLLALSFYFTRSGVLTTICFFMVLLIAFWFNPDLYHGYQFEKDKQSTEKAQLILKDPRSIEKLTDKLKQRVQLYPNDAKAWFLLGRLYAADADWTHAHDALFQAYRLNPTDSKTALFYVETIWHTEGHLNDLARHILKKVIRSEPHQPDALMLLATEARQRNCPREALKYLETLRQLFSREKDLSENIDEAILKAREADDSKCQRSSDAS